ncbi:peptidylprolyl isomerase [Marinihelvus fidelis]|nr:peptidylprolyl isomerase [Marinihelvus fidelis]
MTASVSRLVRSSTMILAALAATPALATQVLFETRFGDFTVELYDDEAPISVANFLEYIESGAYENSIIHRKSDGFVIQGGGHTWTVEDTFERIETRDPIANESGISNTRGTIAMARTSEPDSATSQWFINLRDNAELLDGPTSGDDAGYAVFGEVIGDGMDVVDILGSIQDFYLSTVFTEIPLFNYATGEERSINNYLFTDVSIVSDVPPPPPPFVFNAGVNGAWFNSTDTGEGFYLDVLPDIGLVAMGWYTWDSELPGMDAESGIGDPGQRWLSAQSAAGALNGGTDSVVLNVYNVRGGQFDDYGIGAEQPEAVGTITLSFDDCTTGTVDYTLGSFGESGSIPISRVANDNVALCEALVEAAADVQ